MKNLIRLLVVVLSLILVSCGDKGYTVIDPPVIVYGDYDAARAGAIRQARQSISYSWHPVSNTGSMRPLIDEDCFTVINRDQWNENKVGRILVVGEKLVIHRAIAFGSRGYTMAGINNTENDARYCREDNYKGEVVGIHRWIR